MIGYDAGRPNVWQPWDDAAVDAYLMGTEGELLPELHERVPVRWSIAWFNGLGAIDESRGWHGEPRQVDE